MPGEPELESVGQILRSNYISLNLGSSYLPRSCSVLSTGQLRGLKSHWKQDSCAVTDALRICRSATFKKDCCQEIFMCSRQELLGINDRFGWFALVFVLIYFANIQFLERSSKFRKHKRIYSVTSKEQEKNARNCSEKCLFSRCSPRTTKKHMDNLLWARWSDREHTEICHLAQTQLLFLCHYTGLKTKSIKARKVGVQPWSLRDTSISILIFAIVLLVFIVKALWHRLFVICDLHVKNSQTNNPPLKQAKGLILLPYTWLTVVYLSWLVADKLPDEETIQLRKFSAQYRHLPGPHDVNLYLFIYFLADEAIIRGVRASGTRLGTPCVWCTLKYIH